MHHSYLFFLSCSLCCLQSFSSFYPIRLLFHLFSLPSYQSLTLCLSLTFLPSFSLHIHCYHTSSVPSLHLSHRSFSLFLFFLPLTLSPHPLAHSLPPSLPLTVVTGRSLWLSHRPPVSVLTAPFTCCSLFSFFCWFVLWMTTIRQTQVRSRRAEGVASGEQNSPFESEMCHHGNVC